MGLTHGNIRAGGRKGKPHAASRSSHSFFGVAEGHRMRWLEADLHDRYACWEADGGSFDNNVHIDFTEARTLCEKWEFLWCLFHVMALLHGFVDCDIACCFDK